MTIAIKFNPISLTNRIKKAQTIEELDSLLQEGLTYEYAHPKTCGKWEKWADKRRVELTHEWVKKQEEKFKRNKR